MLSAASGTALLAAAILLVDGGPGPTLGFLLGYATALVGFLDMLGLALLLVSIGGLHRGTWRPPDRLMLG